MNDKISRINKQIQMLQNEKQKIINADAAEREKTYGPKIGSTGMKQ